MRVLLVSPLPPPVGGIARWTERYLAWSRGKFNVDLVNTALIGERAGEAGVKKKLSDEMKRSFQIIEETKKSLREKPDLLHINTSCSKVGIIRDWICVKEAKKAGVPYIVHCHCNIKDQLGSGRTANMLFKSMVKGAAKVLVLNQRSLEFVSPIAAGKAIICPNFVLTEQISDSHIIRDALKKLIYVGDVRFSKGSDDIFKIADMFPDKQFIIVGSVTDEMKQLKKPGNVQLLGRLEADDVNRELDDADIFLFPSLSEGFSNALLEAMARGLPVIATDVGANAEMIKNMGGRVVEVHDIDGMCRAIKELKPTSVREEMSAWNMHTVRKKYEHNIVMNQIMNIYNSICQGTVA